jgi:hypothetical protein
MTRRLAAKVLHTDTDPKIVVDAVKKSILCGRLWKARKKLLASHSVVVGGVIDALDKDPWKPMSTVEKKSPEPVRRISPRNRSEVARPQGIQRLRGRTTGRSSRRDRPGEAHIRCRWQGASFSARSTGPTQYPLTNDYCWELSSFSVDCTGPWSENQGR